MEKVRTILYQSGLPTRFWSEAIKYAAYTHNRLPHRSLTDKTTPYTLWTGKLPSVKHLRPFGIVGYHHIPHTTDRKKLHNRSNICVLVGYATQTKGWRLWYPYSWHSHIVESRDVDWREWQYWRERSETNPVDNVKADHKISHYDLPTAAGRGGAEKTSSSSRSVYQEIGPNTNQPRTIQQTMKKSIKWKKSRRSWSQPASRMKPSTHLQQPSLTCHVK